MSQEEVYKFAVRHFCLVTHHGRIHANVDICNTHDDTLRGQSVRQAGADFWPFRNSQESVISTCARGINERGKRGF